MVHTEVGMIIDSYKEPWAGGKYVAIFSTENWINIETWCINEFKASTRVEWQYVNGELIRVATVKFKRAKHLSWFMLRWA